MTLSIRIARPSRSLERVATMYREGLALLELGRFDDHDGFDGIMVGAPGAAYHFEFTHRRRHPVAPAPTAEDLVVFYVPEPDEWNGVCASMLAAGFVEVLPLNPYWQLRGRSFEDVDGYRVVIQRDAWIPG